MPIEILKRCKRCPACKAAQQKPQSPHAAGFVVVLDGDSYAITVLRQNVSAAVTFLFLVEVLDVLA
jgi:hypothetical protein